MAEVTCPSPFGAISSLSASTRFEFACPSSGTSPHIITWNPDDKSDRISLSNGDLTVTQTGSDEHSGLRAIDSADSGKWYWEVYINRDYSLPPSNIIYVGIGNSSQDLNNYIGSSANSYCYQGNYGRKYFDGNGVSYGDTYTEGDIIGIALDLDARKIWWSKNGVWQAGGNPATGTGEAYSGIAAGPWFPMISMRRYNDQMTARFSLSDQSYSPPDGFFALESPTVPLKTSCDLSVGEIYPGYIDLDEAFVSVTSNSATSQIEISPCILSGASNLAGSTLVEFSVDALSAKTVLSCDHCFNYAQIDSVCPTPTCEAMAVFRYARIEASPPIPTASFRIGRIIEGYCPAPGFTCIAYSGRDPSIIASAPCPTCSMRIGLKFSGDVPIPTCNVAADTHHLATIYGPVPVPLLTCIGDTENITVISGKVPTPTGLLEVTVGNVASIFGRSPCPYCTMVALTGQVVTLSGRVPIPGDLVRFYASLANDTIILTGTVPTPTMTSSIDCFTSSILRHVRGKIR